MRRNALQLPGSLRYSLAVCGIVGLSACGARYAQVPARLDLQPYGKVALVTFSTERANSELSAAATRRFAEEVLATQSRIELLELNGADSSLRGLSAGSDPSSIARALGREKNVPAVFLGQLKVSGVKPRGTLQGAGSVKVRAAVSGELTVQLLSTSTGGTVWRSSAAASSTVGRLAMLGGAPKVSVRDPNDAYGQVVNELVIGVTRDLRPTWIKQ